METQAEENVDEIETTEESNLENKPNEEEETGSTEGSEEVEIVVDGEEQPPSVPLSAMKRRLARSSRQVDTANAGKTEAEERAEMLAEENKLLRLQAQKSKENKQPQEDDYATDAEFDAAVRKFDREELKAELTEEMNVQASQSLEASQTQTVKANTDAVFDEKINAHYERSAKLNVPDYEETEAKAAEIFGVQMAQQIAANLPTGDRLLFYFGKNPEKAHYYKGLIEENPMTGVAALGAFGDTLKVKLKTKNALDPESKLPGGKSLGDDNDGWPEGATFF